MPIQKLFPGLFSEKKNNTQDYLRLKGSNKIVPRADAEKMIGTGLGPDRSVSPGKSAQRKAIGKKKFGVWEIF